MKYDDIALHLTFAVLLVYSRFHIIIILLTIFTSIDLLLDTNLLNYDMWRQPGLNLRPSEQQAATLPIEPTCHTPLQQLHRVTN